MAYKGNDLYKDDYQINDPDLYQCVLKYYFEGLQKQANELDVNIESYQLDHDTGLEISGPRKDDVTQILKYVKEAVRNIKVEHKRLEDGQYFETEEGKIWREDLEHQHGVIMKLEDTIDDQPPVTENNSSEEMVTNDTMYHWTFPNEVQLFIQCGRGVETGAAIVTDAFVTSKIEGFKTQKNKETTIVQFPVPNFKESSHKKRLMTGVWKLFDKYGGDGHKTFAIEVDTCPEWSIKAFSDAILASFVDYYLAGECPVGLQLYLCVTKGDDCIEPFKRCNKVLQSKGVDKFAFEQVNVPSVSIKENKFIRVEVLHGDICKFPADVIVNTTSPDLDLGRGGASRALLKAAGKYLQTFLWKQYKHGIDYGQIAVTKGFNLPCRHILHGALYRYDENTCKETHKTEEEFYKTSVHTFMTDCLQVAIDHDCATISFPVIGTGSLFYPVYIVAEQMFETVEMFESQSILQTVNIVIYDNDEDVLKMFLDLKRKHDLKLQTKPRPVEDRTSKSKLLKIAGTDKGIKAAKEDIFKLLKKEAGGDDDSCPRFQPGQKLGIEKGEDNTDRKFPGKSASRSIQNLSIYKTQSETSPRSVTSPTSPRASSGYEPVNGQTAESHGRSETDKTKCSGGNFDKGANGQASRSLRSSNDPKYPNESNKTFERSLTGSFRSSINEDGKVYSPPHSPRGAGPSNVNDMGASSMVYTRDDDHIDLSVTVTGNTREVNKTEEDKKLVVKVSKEDYELFEYFQSSLIEQYKKRRCLLCYEESEKAIVLYGDLSKDTNIRAVKADVINALKKVKEMQSASVDVSTYDREAVNKHATGLTTGDILCIVDKYVREVTVYSESYDKVHSTVHQLRIRLGSIKETDRAERKFADTTTYLKDMDNVKTANGNDGKHQETNTGGARPKTKTLQKQFSWSSNAEFLEMFHVEKKVIVRVYKANILNLPVDCIVNAANKNLQHGGGIARVISDAAGRDLDREGWDHIHRHGNLKVGEVFTTTAGRLGYSCVIHAVGPNWYDYKPHSIKDVQRCEEDLRKAVYNSIMEAEVQGLKTVAIPGISAGIYACPKELCFIQYARAVWDYSKQARPDKMVQEVHFVDMNEEVVKHVQYTFKAMVKENGKVPKSYDIKRIVAEANRKLHGASDKRRPQSGKPSEHKPAQDKPSEQKQQSDKSGEENPYPYISKKAPAGYSQSEFICVVSPKLSLYVYTAGVMDNIQGLDIIACGETTLGKGTGTAAKDIEKWCGRKFTDDKKKQMEKAKEGDVVVVPGSASTVKYVAHVIMYQKHQTKDQADRQTKMRDIFKKLFVEAKKKGCKGLALPLPGTGQGHLGVRYATERLCEGLNSFATDNPKYELTVHLINTINKKTQESIETIKSLVDKVKKGPSGVAPKKFPNVPKGKDGPNKGPGVEGQSAPKPPRPERPKSATNNKSIMVQQSVGSRSMYGSKTQTQEFHMKAPTGFQAVYDADEKNENYSTEEEEEEEVDKGKMPPSESKDKEKPDDCVICMEALKPHRRRLVCGHEFCEDCIEEQFTYKEACPVCGRVCGLITGDQPDGRMDVTVNRRQSCAGFKKCGRIEITYHFLDGKQGPDHPNPGQWYKGFTRVSYLPDNLRGNTILKMLKIAFDRKLVFTIGSSRTTGQEGVITWNDIHHKTDPKPHSQFGYPDPGYLDRVTDELAAKGVTEKDINSGK